MPAALRPEPGAPVASCRRARPALLLPDCRRARWGEPTASRASEPPERALGPAGRPVGGAPQSGGAGWAGLAPTVLWASCGVLPLGRRPPPAMADPTSAGAGAWVPPAPLLPPSFLSRPAITGTGGAVHSPACARHHPFSPCPRGHPQKWHHLPHGDKRAVGPVSFLGECLDLLERGLRPVSEDKPGDGWHRAQLGTAVVWGTARPSLGSARSAPGPFSWLLRIPSAVHAWHTRVDTPRFKTGPRPACSPVCFCLKY